MPLLNSTIERLNEITTTIQNKNKLSADEEVLIKKFLMILIKKEMLMMSMKLNLGLRTKVVGIIKMFE